MSAPDTLDVFLLAGESSGDQLGGKLMAALREITGGAVAFRGVGGPAMLAQGLDSQFPAADIAVMGPRAILARLPLIARRMRETVASIEGRPPDVLVVIDSPEFSQRVARRARRRLPGLPIIKYVAPQVWAWRQGRAKAMRSYIDHVMALLPFEPEFYARVAGPPTSYVGHPLIEALARYRPSEAERAMRAHADRLIVLPGSRISEVSRLLVPFGETLGLVAARRGPLDVVIPAVPHLVETIRAGVAHWPVPARIVEGEEEKLAAFRTARAALAASGTVTLELALAGVPTVVAYKIEPWLFPLMQRLVKVDTVVLANLVLGRHVMPNLLQGEAVPGTMAQALGALMREGPERQAQLEGLAQTPGKLALDGIKPSEAAARVVLEVFETKTGRKAPRPYTL
jgi:lipid-A-disaccharide synthase